MPKKRRSRRGDFRYTDPSGVQWASQFEYIVYSGLRDSGYHIRKCDERDSFTYHSGVAKGQCLECGSREVVQVRTYTPDLYVDFDPTEVEGSARLGFYIECKGYFPQEKRSLLRSVAACTEGSDIRVVFGKLARLTSARSNVEYVNSIIKMPAGIYKDGGITWYGKGLGQA